MSTLKHPVRFHGEAGRWLVPSESQPTVPNFVDMDEPFCSCEDFKYRRQPIINAGGDPGPCRHMKAVLEEIAMLQQWKAE
jgi:hypothetical protein